MKCSRWPKVKGIHRKGRKGNAKVRIEDVKQRSHLISFFFLTILAVTFAGCAKEPAAGGEAAYVAAPSVALRDRVAAVFNKVGYVGNGEKVTILERSSNKRFARVRTADGKEGWMEVRYLVSQQVQDGFARLERENAKAPAQATAAAKRVTNLHVLPARDAESLYQVKEGMKVELLKRSSTPKSGLKSLTKPKEGKDDDDDRQTEAEKKSSADAAADPKVPDPMEDWWLVRSEGNRYGWVLGRMVDVEIPLGVAQYAEGQRIVASFVLNTVPHGTPAVTLSKKNGRTRIEEDVAPEDRAANPAEPVPQYLVLLSENKDGLAYDFNQVRVFTWNTRRARYETAFRERVEGYLPASVGTEEFGKEGKLPMAVIRDKAKDGSIEERKFKLNGVMFRQVVAPGEKSKTLHPQPPKSATAKKKKK